MWHQGSLLDPRVHIHTINATKFVSTEKYDVVIVDLLDPEYKDFNTGGFWSSLLPVLNSFREKGASIVINGGGILPWKIGTFERLYLSAASLTFEQIIPYKVFVPSFAEEWGFIILTDKPVALKENIHFRYCCQSAYERACLWEKPYKAFSKN
jgi:predicted membrane-bound spermidine synthase